MPNPQTTATPSQMLYGACKIQVATDSAFTSPVDVGAVNGAKLSEELKVVTLEYQNAEDSEYVSDQTGSVEFTQIQAFNEAARLIMRGALDTIENVAGTIVSGATQTIFSGSWGFNTFEPIAHQNGDGSLISITSVTGGTDGALVAETDYFIVKRDDGDYGIMVKDTVDVTTIAQNLVIIYDYTPNASVNYFTGGKSTLAKFYLRMINTDENLKVATWTMLGPCTLSAGDEIVWKKYNEDNPIVEIPVKIKVRKDINLTVGKQLWVKNVTA